MSSPVALTGTVKNTCGLLKLLIAAELDVNISVIRVNDFSVKRYGSQDYEINA